MSDLTLGLLAALGANVFFGSFGKPTRFKLQYHVTNPGNCGKRCCFAWLDIGRIERHMGNLLEFGLAAGSRIYQELCLL